MGVAVDSPRSYPGAEFCFRLVRVFLLTLIIILPMAPITAAREVAFIGAILFLIVHMILDRRFPLRPTPG